MSVEYAVLDYADYAAKFDRWVQSASRNHPELRITPNAEVAWTSLQKALADCMVALVTTAGVRHRDDPPFGHGSPWGDPSYRVIRADADPAALVTDEIHLDTEPAHRDINCLFPISRLRELAQDQVIGSVAPRHFSMLGFLPDTGRGFLESAQSIAADLRDGRVDIAILTPG